jgi:hypothetical protein
MCDSKSNQWKTFLKPYAKLWMKSCHIKWVLLYCTFVFECAMVLWLAHLANTMRVSTQTWGQFLVYRELSAILDAPLFPTLFKPNSWAPFSWLLSPTFYRTLWTLKVNFLVKKLSAVALNYLYLQEIRPWGQYLNRWHCHLQFLPYFWLET